MALFVVSMVLFLSGLWLFYKANQKSKQVRQLHEVRNHIATDLHDDIGATLTSISFFTQAALSKLESNKPDEALKIIEQTGLNAREAVANMNDIVWFINPKNDRFHSLFVRIEDYARNLFSDKNISFYLYFKDEHLGNRLDMEQRKHLLLLCKEALNNAAKYAQCKNVEVFVENQTVIIKDDGVGFDPSNAGDGNGLMNMQYRANQLGAQLTIQSASTGTFIKLSFNVPLTGDVTG